MRSLSNYYPYGMEIEAGSWSGGGYNYGYNGMLKEGIGKEIYNTHFRNLSVGDFVGWWSPDPLEVKFPNVSPYLSMGGNPILFVDFNGDETTLHDDEDDSYRFVDKQNKISDAVHFNLDENNNMQYDVIVPFRYSEADKTLMDAIDDKEINNHIIITDLYRAERVDGSKKFISTGGLFAGSFIGKDKKIHSIQYYNPILANKISEFFKETIKNGEIETHEGLEV